MACVSPETFSGKPGLFIAYSLFKPPSRFWITNDQYSYEKKGFTFPIIYAVQMIVSIIT